MNAHNSNETTEIVFTIVFSRLARSGARSTVRSRRTRRCPGQFALQVAETLSARPNVARVEIIEPTNRVDPWVWHRA